MITARGIYESSKVLLENILVWTCVVAFIFAVIALAFYMGNIVEGIVCPFK